MPARPQRRLRAALSLVAAAALLPAARPADAQYRFREIAASGGRFDPSGFTAPVLNNRGAVAFAAALTDGTLQVLRTSGGAFATIAAQDDFSRFGGLSINDAGQVAFEASLGNGSGEGIFRGSGGAVVRIVGTRDAGPFDFVNAGPSVNAAGRVAFVGETEGSFVAGVYAGDGGAVAAIYDEQGPFSGFTGNPALNTAGQAAFVATLDAGGGGVFLGSGGAVTTVAAAGVGPFGGVFDFGDPTLNNRGDVAFRTLVDGGTGQGIFRYSGGALAPVVTGAFAGLGDPALNDAGGIAFLVEPAFGAQVLTAGADFGLGRVIGSGDLLFGRVVQNLLFSREGLNDRGELAFTALFADGSAGVFLATPATAVPEPATLALLAGALPAVVLVRRRRRAR